jgi:hypothetical protein
VTVNDKTTSSKVVTTVETDYTTTVVRSFSSISSLLRLTLDTRNRHKPLCAPNAPTFSFSPLTASSSEQLNPDHPHNRCGRLGKGHFSFLASSAPVVSSRDEVDPALSCRPSLLPRQPPPSSSTLLSRRSRSKFTRRNGKSRRLFRPSKEKLSPRL